MLKFKRVLIAGALAFVMGSAQAALIDRGGGLIYDNVLNVTWLQDANFAKTSGYDADGLMTWVEANAWASNLVYGGYSDWRLPVSDTACYRPGNVVEVCPTSEMGNLYHYSLGNTSAYEAGAINYGLNNVGPFEYLHEGHGYWSATELPSHAADVAFYFHFAGGGQAIGGKAYFHYAMGVRDGDVAAPIPEPETYAMMLAGLGLLGLLRRKKRTDPA